jgi:probable HAF family extracellular repeat protein
MTAMPASDTRTNRLLIAIACTAGLFACPQSLAQQYTITDLGTPGGEWECHAYALNEAGQVVGSGAEPSPSTPFPPNAFFWQITTGMTDLGALGGYGDSEAADINEAGRVLGWGDGLIFIWDSDSGFAEIDLGPGYATAEALNDAEQIVGTVSSHAFLWQGSTGKIDLGTLGGSSSLAHGINNVGQVVGGARLAGQPSYLHAFLITPDAGVWYRDDNGDGANDLMFDLGALPGLDYSQAYDVNEQGHAVGASYDSTVETIHAFLWNGTDMQDLGTLGGQDSFALALNDTDQVVGYAETAGGEDHAFVWKAGVMFDLNEPIPPGEDWTLLSAQDINNRGQIVGSGIHWIAGEPEDHAFLLTPVPTCPGDVNDDGYRNVTDFTLFASAYGSKLGDDNYNPNADLNGDGFVNVNDFTQFAAVFGVPCL